MSTRRSAPVKPVRTQGRICFGLAWFTSEADAQAYAAWIEERGDTYNGGLSHGCACGRVPEFDYTDAKLGKLFAVSTS